MRLIDADKLHPDRLTKEGLAISQSQIANAQTIEREAGKWIWNMRLGEYECSECGCYPVYERHTPDISEIDKYKYCRWCGAKMEGNNG